MERRKGGFVDMLILKWNTRKPADWEDFLKNSEITEQLINAMYNIWSK